VRDHVLLSALLFLAVLPASSQDHVGQYSQSEIDQGARLYAANCRLCHGPNGDAIASIDLRSGRFRHAASDEELGRVITNGVPGTTMPAHKLATAEVAQLVAYIRSLRGREALTLDSGDAARGQALFLGKGDCLSCHRVGSQGRRTAPDLTEIGAVRDPALLLQNLVDPSAVMRPINRPVRAVTKNGRVFTGRRLNEDTYSVQLIDSAEHLVSLAKSDLREYTVSRLSAMPSYQDKFTPREFADLIAYLVSLRGVE
jgi:putative heme-binding domain-containing protein